MLCKIMLFLLIVTNALGVPSVGVSRDFTPQDDLFSYSSVIKFKERDELRNLPNNKVLNLVKIAYDEMKVDFRTKKHIGTLPRAMIGFVTNEREIYFGLSMTGGRNIFVQEPTGSDDPLGRFDKIRKLLRVCQDGTHTKHNYFDRCGEPNVIDLYMSRHGGYLEDENGPIKGRMFAWDGQDNKIMDPCRDDQTANGRYGCYTFMTKHLPRVELIRNGTPDNTDEDDVGPKYDSLERSWRRYTCMVPEAREQFD